MVIMTGIMIICVRSCAKSTSPKKAASQSQPKVDTLGAWIMAQQFVEGKLKCPSTAKWPCCYDDFTKHIGNHRYEIISYVDAQNGFGAFVRTRFYCVIENIHGSNWKLESLVFEQ